MPNYLQDLKDSIQLWRDSQPAITPAVGRAFRCIVELLEQHEIAVGPGMKEVDARLKALEKNVDSLGRGWQSTDLRSRTTDTSLRIAEDNIEDFGERIAFLEKRVVWLAERADLTPEEWDFIDRSGQRDECERMVRQGKLPDEIRAALNIGEEVEQPPINAGLTLSDEQASMLRADLEEILDGAETAQGEFAGVVDDLLPGWTANFRYIENAAQSALEILVAAENGARSPKEDVPFPEPSGERLNLAAATIRNSVPTMAEAAENLRKFRASLNQDRNFSLEAEVVADEPPAQVSFVAIPVKHYTKATAILRDMEFDFNDGRHKSLSALANQINTALRLLAGEDEVQS